MAKNEQSSETLTTAPPHFTKNEIIPEKNSDVFTGEEKTDEKTQSDLPIEDFATQNETLQVLSTDFATQNETLTNFAQQNETVQAAPLNPTPAKPKKTKPVPQKSELQKRKVYTMAANFDEEEHTALMEIYNARFAEGLSIDKSTFFRQMIHFAINAHKFNKPHFGQPDNTDFSLKNTFKK